MYLEEEIIRTVVFPESHLYEVRSTVVVVSWFFDRWIAIKSDTCSYKSSFLTLLRRYLRQSSFYPLSKFVAPTRQTENSAGALPSHHL